MAHRPTAEVNNSIVHGAYTAPVEPDSVLVIGGGLAGIAAAARLAEAGYSVRLLEARAALGGRIFSFQDHGSGRALDNGQHVIVGACHNFLSFLDRIGARHLWTLQRQLDVSVYDRAGRLGRLYGRGAPSPWHLLPAFLTYPHLKLLDKTTAVRGFLAAIFTQRQQRHLEDMTFYQWLRAKSQSERTIANLWNVLIEGTLNDNVRDVSAAMGLMIVQDGLLGGQNTANIGYPTVPLSEALAQPAQRYLDNLGVRTITGCPVRSIDVCDDQTVRQVTVGNGSVMQADAYVSAVPFWVLPSLLPSSLVDGCIGTRLSMLQASPIVNVHLRYDIPVMTSDFCYFVNSPLQWVFNNSHIFGDDDLDDGQALTISISAAWEYVDTERKALANLIIDEMRRAFPRARDATLLDAVVVKQRNATFRCAPGANRLRPGTHTESPNLFLAGEWTDTGWPSTMESAVISGYNAAEAVMSSVGRPIIAPEE